MHVFIISPARLLEGKKLDELYNTLEKKNTDIYIKRAKQLHKSMESDRRALFTVSLSGVEVIAMADMSYHGTERVLKHMQIIDPER